MTLRARLLIATAAVAVVALLGTGVATYSTLHGYLVDKVDQNLANAARPFMAGGELGRGGERGGGFDPGEASHIAPGYSIAISSPLFGNQVVAAYQAGGKHYQPRLPEKLAIPTSGSAYLNAPAVERGGPSFRLLAFTTGDGGTAVIGQPLGELQATMNRLLVVELIVGLGAVALAVLLGWWLVRLGLRPLTEVEATAEGIDADDLDRRIDVDHPDSEVGRLATVLNSMLDRIQVAVEERDVTVDELRSSEARLRRFVGDASHELRTPIAAVSAYAELFERGAKDRPEDLERVLHGISVESARMGELVEDLLLLARLDDGRPLERGPVDLGEVLGEAAEAHRAIGAAWPLALRGEAQLVVSGDRGRIRQVVDNLLGNVRAHTPEGTAVELVLSSTGPNARIAVVDHGPGIAEEDQGKVFERFYRADPSRSRSSGGSGLGLSIVNALVAAHGGSVELAPTSGGGTTITVELPRVPQAAPSKP